MFMSIYTAYLHSIKTSEYIIGIKFDKDPWAVKKKQKKQLLDQNCLHFQYLRKP